MKKVIYYVPAIFGLVFYCLLAVFSGIGAIRPAVWRCIGMLFVSAYASAASPVFWLGWF